MCTLIKSQTNLKMGHVGSRTKSLGQIVEKTCVCSRGLIYCLILMKLGLNVCRDEISYELEVGSYVVRNKVTRSNHKKTLYTL